MQSSDMRSCKYAEKAKQGRCYRPCSMQEELYSLDLTGTQATRANAQGFMSTVYICLYFSDVGLPLSVGLSIGMGNIVTEHYAFAAEFTLSHFLHLHYLRRDYCNSQRVYYTIAF